MAMSRTESLYVKLHIRVNKHCEDGTVYERVTVVVYSVLDESSQRSRCVQMVIVNANFLTCWMTPQCHCELTTTQSCD